MIQSTRNICLAATAAVICLALLLPAPMARRAHGAKGGGKSPRQVPAQAALADVPAGIEGDGNGPYVDGELDGWAHFVANGNFTLKTTPKGKKVRHPRDLVVWFSPVLGPKQGPGFMAVNDSDCRKPVGDCTVLADFSLDEEGGLRDMGPGETIFVRITGNMADPDNPDDTIFWRCGPSPNADETINNPNSEYFEARCTADDGSGTCTEWKVDPDVDDPTVLSRKCDVEIRDGRGVTTPQGLADVDIDLTIDRL